MTERIINYNKRLFGPGPVHRPPPAGIRGYYARMPPLKGFTYAALHGVSMGFFAAFCFKTFMSDVDRKKCEQYYIENPPR
eukprot:Nitzschia sp. Nitz4//scaffold46_size129759//111379//111618//NITZ4_003522-RA/size129759-exonerate_protein2genome-gene-0.121-mRNA-1//-1//CDS//3329552658//8605//frame0